MASWGFMSPRVLWGIFLLVSCSSFFPFCFCFFFFCFSFLLVMPCLGVWVSICFFFWMFLGFFFFFCLSCLFFLVFLSCLLCSPFSHFISLVLVCLGGVGGFHVSFLLGVGGGLVVSGV